MKYMRTAGYTWTDYKTNYKGIKITQILDKLLEYKRNWIQRVNRMPRNRLPGVMKQYSPTGRRNHGRRLKRLMDTRNRNGSTSGPTPWQIYDDDDNNIEFQWTECNYIPPRILSLGCGQKSCGISCRVTNRVIVVMKDPQKGFKVSFHGNRTYIFFYLNCFQHKISYMCEHFKRRQYSDCLRFAVS